MFMTYYRSSGKTDRAKCDNCGAAFKCHVLVAVGRDGELHQCLTGKKARQQALSWAQARSSPRSTKRSRVAWIQSYIDRDVELKRTRFTPSNGTSVGMGDEKVVGVSGKFFVVQTVYHFEEKRAKPLTIFTMSDGR